MSPFIGKPDEPKPKPPELRTFDVTLNEQRRGGLITDYVRETVDADYVRWTDGLVTFWEIIDGGPHDHLIVGYPLTRIRKIAEQ